MRYDNKCSALPYFKKWLHTLHTQNIQLEEDYRLTTGGLKRKLLKTKMLKNLCCLHEDLSQDDLEMECIEQ